jgi:hypothetical protein
MELTKKLTRWGYVALALFVVAPLFSTVLVSWFATTVQAASRYPACLTSQIKVKVGATMSNVSYVYSTAHAISKKAVPVYFYNKGATCHLLMGRPSIRAVKNTTNVHAIAVSDLSFPGSVSTENRVVVAHHQKVEALFLFGNGLPPSSGRCDPATTTGILVQGYADPTPSIGKFFPRRIRHICFDSGVGAIVSNTGVAWATT